MRGRVTEFDESRGLGAIAAEDGTAYPFHCTQIADGTRTVEVGTEVTYDVRPGPMGRWEATEITRATT